MSVTLKVLILMSCLALANSACWPKTTTRKPAATTTKKADPECICYLTYQAQRLQGVITQYPTIANNCIKNYTFTPTTPPYYNIYFTVNGTTWPRYVLPTDNRVGKLSFQCQVNRESPFDVLTIPLSPVLKGTRFNSVFVDVSS